jgi:two-component system chemotaxis response regulator CheV
MRVPPEMLMAEMGGLVTAVTELEDNRLVMMMDVEKVLRRRRVTTTRVFSAILCRSTSPLRLVFFADDSIVARKQIEKTLQLMNVKYVASVNGRAAWEELDKMATYAESINKSASE